MKKRWMILLSFLAVFLIVTLIMTIRTTSKQPKSQPSTIKVDEQQAIDHLSEAITYQTISYQDYESFNYNEFQQFISFLEKSYPNVHQQLKLEKINQYALVYKWTGSDSSRRPIGLTSHYDVVPVLAGTEGNWEHPPFSGNVADGKIWGRGTLDDKVGVIGILEATELLLKEGFQPDRDIYLMFGFDEEVSGERGARAIADSLKKQGVTLDFVLDEGGAIVEDMVPGVTDPVGVVGVSEKGYATVTLTSQGSGGHSSQPKNITNIGRLSRAIAKLEDTQFPADLKGPGESLFQFVAPEMSFPMKYVFANKWLFEPVIEQVLMREPATAALIRTTIAPTIFQAGEQENALPETATAIINLRLLPGDSLTHAKEWIEKTIDDPDIVVTIEGNEATKVSSHEQWPFKAIQQAARNVYKEAIMAPYLMVAGSDAKHYDAVAKNTYRFLPVQITAEDLTRMHGTNEHISIENFTRSIQFYAELLQTSALKQQ